MEDLTLEEDIDIRISKYQNQFSALEKRIADFILNNKVLIIDSNVSEIAGLCKVSDASVIRFAKKIGYSGFSQLKISVAATITLKDTIHTHSEQSTDPFDFILSNANRTFERTISAIDRKKLLATIRKITEADTLFVLGVGNSYPVALDLVFKFSKLGMKAYTSEVPEIQITSCKNLREKDLVIAISHSGESETVYKACNCAKQNKSDVVLITNYEKSPLTSLADHVISTNVYTSDRNNGVSTFSRMTEHFLVDLMYVLIETELTKKLV